MKRNILTLIATLVTSYLLSQSPENFKYQAVVRDNSGEIVSNSDVGFRFSILKGSETGAAIYAEVHVVNTNEYGLVSLNIGGGTSTDDFSTIEWSNDKYFLKVEVDLSAGDAYVHMGTSQLLSVPYALHSKTADNIVHEGTVTDLDADLLDGEEGSFYTNADNIDSGTLDNDRFSAYENMESEGKLDGNQGTDLLTKEMADNRYIPEIGFFAYNSSDDNYETSAFFTVEFDKTKFEHGDCYDEENDYFVAPLKGVYHFSTSISLRDVAIGDRINVMVYVNNAKYAYLDINDISVPFYTTTGSLSIFLEASDQVKVVAYSEDDNWRIGGNSAIIYTHFSGHLVYPVY